MDTEGGGWEVMRESGTLVEEGLLGGMQGFRGGLMVMVGMAEGAVVVEVEVDRAEAEVVKPGPQ